MKKLFGFIIALGFCLVSCTSVKDLEVKEVKGFSVKHLDQSGMESELSLEIYNPNSFGFYILPSAFEIRYSGVYLGTAKLVKKVKIKGKEQQAYNFQLRNDFKNINFLELLNLLQPGKHKDEMQVKGELKARKFLYKKKFPVDFKQNIGLN